jgi:hypothetical protein
MHIKTQNIEKMFCANEVVHFVPIFSKHGFPRTVDLTSRVGMGGVSDNTVKTETLVTDTDPQGYLVIISYTILRNH